MKLSVAVLLATAALSGGCSLSKRSPEAHRATPPRAAQLPTAVIQDKNLAIAATAGELAPTNAPSTDGVRLTAWEEPLPRREPAPSLVNPAAPAAPADAKKTQTPAAPQASAAAEAEQLPPPSPGSAVVSLEDVIVVVYSSFPAIDAATRERQIAAGKLLATMGQFDLNLVGAALAEPLGFYENYRSELGVKQYQWGGAQTFAGYRLGRGSFEPWYLERQTNQGGEFKAGVALPFLRDRDIDKRRAAVFKSQLDRSAAEPAIQLEIIDAVRAASLAYWDWVAAGQRVRVARELLELASVRQQGLQKRSDSGDVAGIELVDNERLVVSRQAKLIDAERKLQQASIKLSLFLRGIDGTPLLAAADQLPGDFPPTQTPDADSEPREIAQAVALRPELRLVDLGRQRAEVDARHAANQLLPGLNGLVAASQDVGEPTSSKRDKSELELEAGLVLDVPLQRRAARGKLQAAQGKIAQFAAKRRLIEQKVTIEVQASRAGLAADFAELQKARESVKLAEQMEQAERKKFDRGDSNILLVNLREQSTTDSRLLVVDAAADYFMSEALLHAATAAELIVPQEIPQPTDVP